MCCPIPTQPGHPVVRPYLSRMLWRRYNLFARLPTGQLILWLDRWSLRRTFCCRIPRAANTTQVQELQVPSAITLKTSHTTCLCCSCWRQDSSHPPHVQFGSIFRIVSSQADLSKWHNFSSVVLEDYDMAFSQILSLENCSRPHALCRTIQPISTCSGPISVLYFNGTASRKARSCP